MKKYFKELFILLFISILFIPYTIKADDTFTVHFETQGGTEVPDQIVDYGGLLDIPQDPTNNDLEFIEWRTSDNTLFNFARPIYEDLTLYAAWKVRINAYAVPNGSGIVFTGNNPENGSNTISPTWTMIDLNTLGGLGQIANAGYRFVEWRIGSAEGEIVSNDTTQDIYDINGDLIFKLNRNYNLYAIYEEVSTNTVTFNMGNVGASQIDPVIVNTGGYLIPPEEPTASGYNFVAWYKEAELINVFEFETDVITEDITLYAKWEEKPAPAHYTVTFNTQGGTQIPPQVVEEGSTAIRPQDNPENNNLEFIDWMINNSTSYDFNTPVTEDITIYAKWKVTGIAYAYPSDGGVVYSGNNPSFAANPKEAWWGVIDLNSRGGFQQMANTGYYFKEWRIGSKTGEIVGTSPIADIYTSNGNITFRLNQNHVFYAIFERYVAVKPKVTIKSNANKVTLSWDYQEAAIKYTIQRSTDNKKWSTIKTVTDTSYVDTGLTYGKKYYYKVKACDYFACSKYSDVVYKTIKPSKVKLSILSAGTNNIRLSWEKVNVTGYEISRSTDNKNWTTIKTIKDSNTLIYKNTSLKENKTYYYKARAYKTVSGKKVYGGWSSVVSTKTAPLKPTAKLNVTNYNAMKLEITSVKGASYYVIHESNDGNEYTLERQVSSSELKPIEYKGYEIGRVRYLRIKSCNKQKSCSSWVYVEKKQTTKTPKLTLSSTTKNKVKVEVGSVSNADGYKVYRATKKNGTYELVKEILSGESLTFNDKTTKGKTYYYKVKSYKIVDESKVYSSYSSVKSIVSK